MVSKNKIYSIKMKILSKVKVLLRAIEGYGYKLLVDLNLLEIPNLNNNSSDIIISLTSYGRRVSKCIVYYTLISLLRQTEQPQRIILWLSENEWKNETLPNKLQKLRDKGIEIRFCLEIRSFKKLIPCLEFYPDCNIMTVDDDIIYTKDTLSIVAEAHRKNPTAVVCLNASMPVIDNGLPSCYSSWEGLKHSSNGMLIFPVGCGGILYPKGALHSDVIRKELFTKLCPYADDIWFWFCSLRNNTEKYFVKKPNHDLSFDAIYQYFHKGSALTHTNRFQHANDKQFYDLFRYYGVRINSNGNLDFFN